jgi:transaldolase
MILVDTAKTGEIAAALENSAVRGFTTNPRLIAQATGGDIIAARDYYVFCRKLSEFAGRDQRIRHVMIQAIGEKAQTRDLAASCLEQLTVERLGSSASTLWIKLPPTLQYLRCIDGLRREGCKTLVTAVFTPVQALMAMESGADGIAVYFGRLMKSDAKWQERLKTICEIVHAHSALLLMASLSEPTLVTQALDYSRDLTVPPTIVPELMDAALSQAAMKEFSRRIAAD